MPILAPEKQVINKKVILASSQSEPNPQLIEHVYHNHPPEAVELRLSFLSARDGVWDTQRAKTSIVGDIYAMNSEFSRYGDRMADCSGFLGFGLGDDGLKLKQASFCRVRYCPVCQWRRSLLWKANMYVAYEDIKDDFPTHRWLFLTLTVKNCEVTDLRKTLQDMNKAWQRLIKRKQFNVVDGWIRTTEVTKGKDGTAHPHFHIMLLVKASYFTRNYIKQAEWVRLWRDVMRLDYAPVVDVRTIKAKKKDKYTQDEAVKYAIMETLKYSVKPSDMMADYSWFYELTKQTHKLRFIASGGALKDALKSEKDISNDDMIATGDEENSATDERRWVFLYNKKKGYYAYSPKHNQ